METESDVYCIIIEWMISEAKNKDYINKLEQILTGVKNQIHIEENRQPRFQSIVLFGINLFPYKTEDYREMAILIKG